MKISSGEFKGRTLKAPKGLDVRPTSEKLRQAFFNICQNSVEGSVFLDLFAGTGAIGLEALSRGAKNAVFIERNLAAIHCIRENISSLKVEDKTTLIKADALHGLMQLNRKKEFSFDLVYIDPPYRVEALLMHILEFLDSSQLLKERSLVFVETGKEKLPHLKLSALKKEKERDFGDSFLYQFTFSPFS